MRFPNAPTRVVLLACAVLSAAILVAGCGGGSGGQSSGSEGETITVPAGAEGFYGELRAILDRFPFQQWYEACVVREAKTILGPEGAEELEGLPQTEREKKAQEAAAKAEPVCEKTGRPTVDPNASSREIQLLRASSIPGITEFAEENGMSSTQVECVQSFFGKPSDKEIIELRNGTDKAREGILVSVIKPCAELE